MTAAGRARATGRASAGYALIGVVFFAAVGFALLAVGYERIHQATLLAREGDGGPAATGISQALGIGLSLLQTGTPPDTPFTCVLNVRVADGTSSYQLTYSRIASSECGTPGGACWSVEVAPWAGEAAPESSCPAGFSAACGGGI